MVCELTGLEGTIWIVLNGICNHSSEKCLQFFESVLFPEYMTVPTLVARIFKQVQKDGDHSHL